MDSMSQPPSIETQTSGYNEHQVASHASWLYWVAALSALNLILFVANIEWEFAIGLGITSLLVYLGTEFPQIQIVTIAISAVIIGMIAVLGYFACRGAIWALILGLVVLILDTVLLLIGLPDTVISIAIHVWAAISVGNGLRLVLQAKKT